MASNRAYDSGDMQRVINSLRTAIQQTQAALSYMESVSYGSLIGELRDALEERINKQKVFLGDELKRLNGDLSQMEYLKTRLERG